MFSPAPFLSVSSRAAFAGAAFVGLRPSVHAPSGWVGVCVFPVVRAARLFARAAAVAFGLPFCAVRRRASGWFVSVPVAPPAAGFPLWAAVGGGLPAPVAAAFVVASSAAVAFCGSRSVAPPPAVAAAAAAAVPAGLPVLVGCAGGADAVFRRLCPAASVFSVASGRWGRGRGAFAGRSAALVSSLLPSFFGPVFPGAMGGLLVAFPGGPCPAGLFPSRSARACFGGFGSGSWSSVALAVGLGLPVLLWLPAGVVPPSGLCGRSGWFFSSLGAGWWGWGL